MHPEWGRVAVLLAVLLAGGCRVPVHRQGMVSRPLMQFSDSPAYAYQPTLLLQTEAGAGATGGAQAAGCTSCR